MSIKSTDLINVMNQISPERLSEDWDNSGVQIHLSAEVNKVLVALEINEEIVNEAIDLSADMVVVHHPFYFSSIKKIDDRNLQGNLTKKLIQNNISVYAMHTSFDSVKGGNNDYIAKLMGWQSEEPMIQNTENTYKVVVFVPVENFETVKNAMCNAGAGHLGEYEDCVFYHEGTGSFKPIGNAEPHIGEVNQTEKVQELRLESVVAENDLSHVVSQMIKAHPYEEPAFDIIKLENKLSKEGLGRIIKLDQPIAFKDLVRNLKMALDINDPINVTVPEEKNIKSIAICTGSGSDLIRIAKSKNCDVMITGDIKYHDAQMAKDMHIGLIDIEHYHSEKIFIDNFAELLMQSCSTEVEIIKSKVDINPFEKI